MASLHISSRVVAAGAINSIGEVIARHGLGKKLLLVCDDAIWRAAGQSVSERLSHDYSVEILSLGAQVHATVSNARSVQQRVTLCDGLIAVGSGTVNDVAKYAAAMADKPYLCVATAASMNGYSSASASLMDGGLKQSYAAKPPRAVIVDLSVIAAAPARMARAGLADTLCRTTVETDMLLSQAVLGTAYPPEIFAKLRAHEDWLIANADAFQRNDLNYYARLMDALLDAGDAMTVAGSSAIASQGEHMIAHMLELVAGDRLPDVLHGELIAVTTLTLSRLQQRMLAQPILLQPMPTSADVFVDLFGVDRAAVFEKQYAKKYLNESRVAAIDMEAMKRIMCAPEVLEQFYRTLGMATTADGLGIRADDYARAVRYAYLSRDRFTFLDVAAMAG